MKTKRRKARRFPETQVRLQQLTDEVRLVGTRLKNIDDGMSILAREIVDLRGLVFAAHAVPTPPAAGK